MNLTALDLDTDAVIFPLDEGRTRGRCRDENCRAEMVAVRESSEEVDGEKVVWRRAHWRHKHLPEGVNVCTRRDSKTTLWHVDWQRKCVDPERIEYRVGTPGRCRIADVFTRYGWALEFQHSRIEKATVTARENHYRGRVLWVVNAHPTYSISGAVDTWKGDLRWTSAPPWVVEAKTMVAVDDGFCVHLLPPGGLRTYAKGGHFFIPVGLVKTYGYDEFADRWINGDEFPLPVVPSTEWSQAHAAKLARSRDEAASDRRLKAASAHKGMYDQISAVCAYTGDRDRLAYPDDQPARLTVIGESSYTIPMCRAEGCISSAGRTGWCWSHRPDQQSIGGAA